MKAPATTNLIPMTYKEAAELYLAVRRRFSFVAAPYMVLKTIVVFKNGTIVAAPPDAG